MNLYIVVVYHPRLCWRKLNQVRKISREIIICGICLGFLYQILSITL